MQDKIMKYNSCGINKFRTDRKKSSNVIIDAGRTRVKRKAGCVQDGDSTRIGSPPPLTAFQEEDPFVNPLDHDEIKTPPSQS